MRSVQFPMIRATCDKNHVTQIPYTPTALTKTGGCDCRRDSGGHYDYCYCPPERTTFEWYCEHCEINQRYVVEID